jgi:hypothetical protein
MKKMKYIAGVFTLAASMYACTDLSEETYSIMTDDKFGKTEAQVQAQVGEVYTSLRGGQFGTGANGYLFGEYLVFLATLPTDETFAPAWGGNADWYDGGRYYNLMMHQWTPSQDVILGAWRYCYAGIGRANAAIYLIERSAVSAESKAKYAAQCKAVRAYYYMQLLDWFGNVPLVTEYATAAVLPTNKPISEQPGKVFRFIEQELKDLIDGDLLPSAAYGRITTTAAKVLLARLYLNANVYIGQDMYSECLQALDGVTGTLNTDYFANFRKGNKNSEEILFAIPPGNVYNTERWHQSYGIDLQLWGGLKYQFVREDELTTGDDGLYENPLPDYAADDYLFCVQPGYYRNTYTEDGDVRKGNIFGYDTLRYSDGAPVYVKIPRGDENNRSDVYACHKDTSGAFPAVLSETLADITDRKPYEGWVWNKQAIDASTTWEDLYNKGTALPAMPVIRYAEVLMMRAECAVRGAGGDALPPLNEVRSRAGLGAATSATLEDIERELRREFPMEGRRRTDMKRFGIFTQSDHFRKEYNGFGQLTQTGSHLNLYPIPQKELDMNHNLEQNPGY